MEGSLAHTESSKWGIFIVIIEGATVLKAGWEQQWLEQTQEIFQASFKDVLMQDI